MQLAAHLTGNYGWSWGPRFTTTLLVEVYVWELYSTDVCLWHSFRLFGPGFLQLRRSHCQKTFNILVEVLRHLWRFIINFRFVNITFACVIVLVVVFFKALVKSLVRLCPIPTAEVVIVATSGVVDIKIVHFFVSMLSVVQKSRLS